MTFQITYLDDQSHFRHRHTVCDALVEAGYHYIDEISVVVGRLLSDNGWWIIARMYDGDAYHTDIGPYDDAETATVHMKLLADVCESS